MTNNERFHLSRVRIQLRDTVVLAWLAEGRVSTLEAVKRRLEIHQRDTGHPVSSLSMRAVRYIVNRWVKAGLVTLERNPWGGNGIVVAHRPALDLVNASKDLRAGMPSLGTLRHALEVQSVGVELMWHKFQWTHEIFLPWNNDHRPDGHAMKGNEAFAVEVDLTRKSRERWLTIAQSNVMQYGSAIYFTTPQLIDTLSNWVSAAGMEQVCHIYLMPPSGSAEVSAHVA